MLDRDLVREEKLRYSILSFVYQRAGANCEVAVTGPEIGAELQLGLESLYSAITFLNRAGYLAEGGVGPRVCITPKGVEYMEVLAGRRKSVRS